ncbi:MAG: hypothetical protein AB7V58_05535 [Solirubrobacterales bacterium]
MTHPKEQSPELFIDRSLGKSIVEGLRDTGLTVHSMADIYGEKRAQLLADEVWLRDAGKNDWIVLTKDDAIRRRPAERDALTKAAVRVFCLTNRNLRGAEQTKRFASNRHRILRQARNPGPYIYGVYEKSLKRLWP